MKTSDGNRIRYLRKDIFELTMEKFGEKVGVTKVAISNIENGNRSLTDQMIASICNVNWNGRRVSETWLRTGEGEPFLQEPVDEAARFAEANNLPKGTAAILRNLMKLDDRRRQEASEFILKTCQDILAEYGRGEEAIQVEKQEEASIDEKVEAYRKALEEEAAAKARSQVS